MSVIDTIATRGRTEAGADLSMLAGRWVNTNERTRGIAEIRAVDDGGVLQLNVVGATLDWGIVPANVYFARNDEGLEQPFIASYDFVVMDVTLQGFLRQGVLVVLSFIRFRDGSRANYFSKEFFHRVGP